MVDDGRKADPLARSQECLHGRRGSSPKRDLVLQKDLAAGQKSGRRSAVMVIGMHRSGTSAVTRLIHKAGFAAPLTLVSGDPNSNPDGHWESLPIVHLNDDILASFNTTWSGLDTIPPGWSQSADYAEYTTRAISILDLEFGNTTEFVLKDPRICRLLPFWLNALKIWGADPQLVCVTRAPGEVAKSLYARDGIFPVVGELVWLRHVLDAELAGRGVSRLHLTYANLIEFSQTETTRLLAGLSGNKANRPNEDLIDYNMRHHREGGINSSGRPASWILSVSEILDRWGSGGEDPNDYAVLDSLRTEFEEMIDCYGYLMNESVRALALARKVSRRALSPAHAPDGTAVHTASVFIRASPLFDGEWYLTKYKDVADAGIDPAIHFVKAGDAELRDPGPDFSTSKYLGAHSDVASAGINALVHFMVYGASEGRATFPSG